MLLDVTTRPLTIEYIDLLKAYGHPDAPEVQEFLERHREDAVFQARARVLNKVFLIDTLVPSQSAREAAVAFPRPT